MLLGNKSKEKKNSRPNKHIPGLIKNYAINPIFFLVLCIFSLIGFSVINSNTASATTVDKMVIDDETNSYLYYQALSGCIKTHGLSMSNKNITESDANNFNWFAASTSDTNDGKYEAQSGVGINYDSLYTKTDKPFNCTGKPVDWIQKAVALWGYKDGIDAICDFGIRRVNNSDCRSGNGMFVAADNSMYMSLDTFQKNIKAKVYSAGATDSYNITSPVKYHIYKKAFFSGCLGNLNAQPYTGSDTGDKIYQIQYIDMKTGLNSLVKYQGTKSKDWKVVFYLTPRKWDSKTCAELETELANESNAKLYGAAVKANIDSGLTEQDLGADKTSTTESEATCGSTVKGLGWIMCPVINGLVFLNDGMWSLTSSLLKTNPLNQNDNIFKAWSAIRNIANLAFAIAFLVIIFSQISSIGIGNYGIKKLLPRLIICAILVNISFFVVQVMVDIANIAGSSIYNILQSLVSESASYKPEEQWQTLFKAILSGAIGFGAFTVASFVGAEVLFWMLLPVLIMATLAFFAALFTLIFRSAIIPVLAILAPLAFVAYLLPNTEQWFKKWKDMLIKMLMLYPLAALVFGGARLAAVIVIGDGKNIINGFIGGIIMTLPLFSLPFLAKSGGDILNKVNGALTNLAEKARNPVKGWSKSHQDLAQSKHLADENGRSQRRVLGLGHRTRRRFAMRKMSREMNTESNMENFRSEWSRNPYLEDNGDQRVPTQDETKEARRRGNGHEAMSRSIDSKKLADIRKVNAEAGYLRSQAGQTMHSNLTSAKALGEKAELDATYASNAANKNKLINNIEQKKKNELQEKTIEKRANERDKVKAYNRGLVNNQLRMKELSQETELAVHESAVGQRLHDNINLNSDKNKEHELDSELRVAKSNEGQAVKKRILGVQDDIKTAQNQVNTAYHKDPATLKSRIMASASEKVSNAAMAKTKSTIAEMGVRKLDASGNPIKKEFKVGGVTQYDNSGNVLYEHDSDGNVLYEYASQPIAGTGMTANEASIISGQMFNSDKDLMMDNMKEKSAQGLSEFRTHSELSKSDAMADYVAGVGGESKFGPTIKQATAAQIISDDTKKSVTALKANYANNGLANDEFIQMIESGYELKKNASGDWEPDMSKPLSPEGHMAAFSSGFVSGHTPTQRKMFDAMMKVTNPADPRYDTMTELRKAMAPEIFSAPNRYNFISKSVLNKLKNGETDREYTIPAQILKGVKDGKPSPQFIAKVGADEMNDVAKTFVANPISDAEDFKGRLSMLNNIIAAREDPIIKQTMPPEAMVEQDFALDVLYNQLQAFKSINMATLGTENITDPSSRPGFKYAPPPDNGVRGYKHSRTAEPEFTR